jgi:hypothetical protein
MLVGTLFTLFVLPSVYTLLSRAHKPVIDWVVIEKTTASLKLKSKTGILRDARFSQCIGSEMGFGVLGQNRTRYVAQHFYKHLARRCCRNTALFLEHDP